MTDGVTESYLAELEECRALVRALKNELHERNEDLDYWRGKVERLAAGARRALDEFKIPPEGMDFPLVLAHQELMQALADWDRRDPPDSGAFDNRSEWEPKP